MLSLLVKLSRDGRRMLQIETASPCVNWMPGLEGIVELSGHRLTDMANTRPRSPHVQRLSPWRMAICSLVENVLFDCVMCRCDVATGIHDYQFSQISPIVFSG